MTVECKRDYKSLRIYINDLLHFHLLMDDHDGLQSWFEGNKRKVYIIEFYRKGGEPIQLEYIEEDLWKNILKQLSDNI